MLAWLCCYGTRDKDPIIQPLLGGADQHPPIIKKEDSSRDVFEVRQTSQVGVQRLAIQTKPPSPLSPTSPASTPTAARSPSLTRQFTLSRMDSNVIAISEYEKVIKQNKDLLTINHTLQQTLNQEQEDRARQEENTRRYFTLEKQTCETQIKEKQTKIEDLQTDLVKIKRELAKTRALEKQIQEQQIELTQQEEEIRSLREKSNELLLEKIGMQEELDYLQKELSEFREAGSHINSEQAKSQKIAELTEELENQKREIEQLNDRIELLQKKLVHEVEKEERMKINHGAMVRILDNIDRRQDDVFEKEMTVAEQVQILEKTILVKIHEYRAQLRKNEREKQELDALVSELRARNEKLQIELTEREKQVELAERALLDAGFKEDAADEE